jgi:hypothetical protein
MFKITGSTPKKSTLSSASLPRTRTCRSFITVYGARVKTRNLLRKVRDVAGMTKTLCAIGCFLLAGLAAAAPTFSQEMYCIGDYKGRGPDQGFYWFFVNLRINDSVVEKMVWETSYASDLVHVGRTCKVDTTGFLQTRQKDNSILLVDPRSKCSISLTPKKNDRNTFFLESEGCIEQFCSDKGVLIPLTVHMSARKCVPRPMTEKARLWPPAS